MGGASSAVMMRTARLVTLKARLRVSGRLERHRTIPVRATSPRAATGGAYLIRLDAPCPGRDHGEFATIAARIGSRKLAGLAQLADPGSVSERAGPRLKVPDGEI